MEPKKRMHSCDICGKGFQRDQAWNLRRHLYLVHGIGRASNFVVAVAENRRMKRDTFGKAVPRPKDRPTLHEVVRKNFAGNPENTSKRREPDIFDPEPKPAKPKPTHGKAATLEPEPKKPKTAISVTEHEEDFVGMEETEKEDKGALNLVDELEVQTDDDIQIDEQFDEEESEEFDDEEYEGEKDDNEEKEDVDDEKFELEDNDEEYEEHEGGETPMVTEKPETKSIVTSVPAKKKVPKPKKRPLRESTVPPKKEVLKPEGKIISGTAALKKKVPKSLILEPKSKKEVAHGKVEAKEEVTKYPKGKPKQEKEQKSEKKAGKTPFLTLDLSMHPHVIITTRAAYILRHD